MQNISISYVMLNCARDRRSFKMVTHDLDSHKADGSGHVGNVPEDMVNQLCVQPRLLEVLHICYEAGCSVATNWRKQNAGS